MKRSPPQSIEITFCVSTEWTEDKVINVQHVCLFIYFYRNILIEAEIPPAVQNVWKLLYADTIVFWYITPCVCVFMFPRTIKGDWSSFWKTLHFKTGPPYALVWVESYETSQPGHSGSVKEKDCDHLSEQRIKPEVHQQKAHERQGLPWLGNTDLFSVFLMCALHISQKHTLPFYSSKRTHRKAKH